MDADQAASDAAPALAQRRWGVTPAEKGERRRADLLDELVRLDHQVVGGHEPVTQGQDQRGRPA